VNTDDSACYAVSPYIFHYGLRPNGECARSRAARAMIAAMKEPAKLLPAPETKSKAAGQ
jgi:hypothetical protein